jgi:hypothetical protein
VLGRRNDASARDATLISVLVYMLCLPGDNVSFAKHMEHHDIPPAFARRQLFLIVAFRPRRCVMILSQIRIVARTGEKPNHRNRLHDSIPTLYQSSAWYVSLNLEIEAPRSMTTMTWAFQTAATLRLAASDGLTGSCIVRFHKQFENPKLAGFSIASTDARCARSI